MLEGLKASLEVDKVELEAERGGEGFEDAATGGDDLFADAVTRDKTYESRN